MKPLRIIRREGTSVTEVSIEDANGKVLCNIGYVDLGNWHGVTLLRDQVKLLHAWCEKWLEENER